MSYLILREHTQAFTSKYDVSCGFFIDTLYQVEEVLSICSLLSVFLMIRCWILSNAFLCLMR